LLAYDIAYPGDFSLVKNEEETYDLYKGDVNIVDDYSIIDKLSEKTGTQLSILYLNTRVHTTFKSASGNRLNGLLANSDTVDKVLYNQKEAFYEDIDVLGTEYIVLYVPIYSSNGNVLGIAEVAKETASLKKNVLRAVWPILALSIPGMILAAFIAFETTKHITDVLRAIQVSLNHVATGNLQAELNTKYLRREDELGEISRSSVLMQKSIRASVETDPLTGLFNRRYLLSAVPKITERSKETGEPYCVAICDIDFFKKVNDTYGHNCGDDVLKEVAKALKQFMERKGFASRWGGEEFVLIFTKSSASEAFSSLDTLMETIRNMTIHSEGNDIRVTLTIGLADGDNSDINRIVEKADEKLYYGKEHGRNQVVYEIPKKDD
ncbi:MAG: diguanylate cyclase, partial [Lachnospiraceae bacterium]|nr:diguanylate cyclase [Lachnospiraceae bacterium]